MKKQILITLLAFLGLAKAQNYELKVGRNPLLIEESDSTYFISNQDKPYEYIHRYHKDGRYLGNVFGTYISPSKVSLAKGPNGDLYYFGIVEPGCTDMIVYQNWFMSLGNKVRGITEYSDGGLDEPFVWVKNDLLYLGTGDYIKKYQLLNDEYQIIDSTQGSFNSIRLDKDSNRIVCAGTNGKLLVLNEDLDTLEMKSYSANHLLLNKNYYYLLNTTSHTIIRMTREMQVLDSLKNVDLRFIHKNTEGFEYIYNKPLLNDSLLIIANDRKISIYDTALVLKREIVDTASRSGAQFSLYKNQLLVLRDEHIKSFDLKGKPSYGKNIKISDLKILNLEVSVVPGLSSGQYFLKDATHQSTVTLTNVGQEEIDSVSILLQWIEKNPISGPCESYVHNKIVVKSDLNLGVGDSITVDLGTITKSYFGGLSSPSFPTSVQYSQCASVSFAPDNHIDADHNDNETCTSVLVLVTDINDRNLSVSQEVYPNPCEDVVNLLNPSINSYEVYTPTGNLLRSGLVSNTSINVSTLLQGLYVLKLHNINGEQSVVKIVKK